MPWLTVVTVASPITEFGVGSYPQFVVTAAVAPSSLGVAGNTRIAEAQREGWFGEVEGLQVSLTGAKDKLAQINRRPLHQATIDLGMPTTTPNP